MQMPQIGPEHDTLKRMLGTWEGKETLFPAPWNPERQERTSRLTARSLEGFFVVSDYEQSMGGEVVFRGHGVYGWDPRQRVYTMYWFDSMGGGGGVAQGTLEKNVLTFHATSPMGHHRYRYMFDTDGYVFELAMSADGATWNPFLEGRYRRVGG